MTKRQKIEFCSLDFLMFVYEQRLEEEELIDEGSMEEWECSSVDEMRKGYAKYLRSLASY